MTCEFRSLVEAIDVFKRERFGERRYRVANLISTPASLGQLKEGVLIAFLGRNL
jgi:hypothetical protein